MAFVILMGDGDGKGNVHQPNAAVGPNEAQSRMW